MIEFKRGKKSRSKNALFNPYKNGISEYDMAFLSSKKNAQVVNIAKLKIAKAAYWSQCIP